MSITRVDPLISVEQLIKLVELAVSSKTNEIEIEVARAIRCIASPPFICDGDIEAPGASE